MRRFAIILLITSAVLLASSRRTAAQMIGGEVVETLTKQPLRGYHVRLFYRSEADSALACDSATTDERGLFQMGGRGPGRYRLEFGPSHSRLETSAEVTALTADTAIAARFTVPLLELGGAEAFSEREVQQVAHERTVVPLRYPKDMLSYRLTGKVVVRFIVDPSGRVRTGSEQVLSSTNPSFTRAILEALRTMTFDPARVGGIAVPQVVEMPFTFSIDSR